MATVTDEQAIKHLDIFATELAGLAAECHRDKELWMENPWEERYKAIKIVIRAIRCRTHWGEKQVLREEARARVEADPDILQKNFLMLEEEEQLLLEEVALSYSVELKGKIWNLKKEIEASTNKVVIPIMENSLKGLESHLDHVKRGIDYLEDLGKDESNVEEVKDINSMSVEEFNAGQTLNQDLLDQ